MQLVLLLFSLSIVLLTTMIARLQIFRYTTSGCVSAVLILGTLIPFVYWVKPPPVTESELFRAERLQQQDAAAIAKRLSHSGQYRISVSPDIPEYKVLTHLLSNENMRAIRGNIHPQPALKFQTLFFPSRAVSRLYGVKYTIVAAGTQGAENINERYALQTDPTAFGRLFLVEGGIKVVRSTKKALAEMPEDSSGAAYISERQARKLGILLDVVVGGVFSHRDLILSQSNAVKFESVFMTSKPAILVLNEDPAAHWYALVDGRIEASFSVNGYQTGFLIPSSGRHSVVIWRPTTLASWISHLLDH